MSDFSDSTRSLLWPDTRQTDRPELFIRTRLNSILAEAIKKPVTMVCAGIGYGKTIAVRDFIRECGIPAVWMRFTEFDNVSLSFWETYTRAIEQISKSLAEECRDLTFPDTEDKLSQYILQRDRRMAEQRYLMVLDDLQFITDPNIIKFLEHILYNTPQRRTLILICRDQTQLNLSSLMVRDMVSLIVENDLNFTENEMAQYLLHQGLIGEIHNLSDIYMDTKGWAFIVNFLVRILKKTPGYTGYARRFIKQNIFQLMEREAWDVISERLQRFLTRLSLVNRLSAELVALLAEDNESLLMELNQQRVVYLRFDSFTGCYLIHHLFLDYLHSKQNILDPKEVFNTYKIAAEWSSSNGFFIEALSYYEKIGDYKSIVTLIDASPAQMLLSVIQHLKGIFDRAPKETFDLVAHSACTRVRIDILAGLYPEALELLIYYEQKFLKLPAGNKFRGPTLWSLYYLWGILRQLMCTVDDVYDFDLYYKKMNKYPMGEYAGQISENYPIGPYLNRAGVSREGAPQEYIEAIARSQNCVSDGAGDWMAGQTDMARGELLLYQGETHAAKPLIARAQESMERCGQHMTLSLVLFYDMRIAFLQGDYEKAVQTLRDFEKHLEKEDYYNRFTVYDLALGLYYSLMRHSEKIPDWLRGKFTAFVPTNYLNTIGNQIKAHYFYQTGQYPTLLAHIEERKLEELTLFERVDMLSVKACTHYQLKDKTMAYETLRDAYVVASPNGIVLPFAEMGKDMRTLTMAALRAPDCDIPQAWLKNINQKSSIYARHQTLIVSEYNKANNISAGMLLTHRETEVLRDLYKGFSRSEIADKQDLSINTVRLIINTIYDKLDARNIVDLIRIANEQMLI